MTSSPRQTHAVFTLAGVVVATALCICWVLFRSDATLAQDGAPAKAVNPHWDKNACRECHVTDAANPRKIDIAKADATCLRCHDGKAASSEIHPIGRAIDRNTMDTPKDWPLSDGLVACLTCHDVKIACSKNVQKPDDDSRMLRETEPIKLASGDIRGKPFCISCHREEQFEKFNPHVMLTVKKEIVQDQCLACHKSVPDHNITRPAGKPDLIANEFMLCKACHPHHEDQFNPGHIGAKAKPEILAFMRARESVGLVTTPSKELVAKLQAEGAKPTLMRTTDQNLLTCSTCHNPHQVGLFKPGTPAAYNAMRVIGKKAISPVHTEQFCTHCHSDM